MSDIDILSQVMRLLSMATQPPFGFSNAAKSNKTLNFLRSSNGLKKTRIQSHKNEAQNGRNLLILDNFMLGLNHINYHDGE